MLSKKAKNRRHERENILEVKMHSKHVRLARVRMATIAFAVTAGTILSFALLWTGSDFLLRELVFKNNSFAIREVLVQTDGVIPINQIRAWSGVRSGDNLLRLDLLRIKRDLELAPSIQSAMVERVLPDTLRIQVIEREPVARIAGYQAVPPSGRLEPRVFFLDEAGYVLLPLSPSATGGEELPMLMGVQSQELRPGRQVESAQIHAALRLIANFGVSPMASQADLRSIDLSTPQLLEVSTWQGGKVTFSVASLENQLRRWRLVQDFAAKNNRGLATLDLSVSNNVPARWLEADAALPPIPKLSKPSRYRKKHV